MKNKFLTGFIWGILAVFIAGNLGLGYFNIKMLKDKRHYSLFNTDSECNFVDAKTQVYQDVMFPAELPSVKKGKY